MYYWNGKDIPKVHKAELGFGGPPAVANQRHSKIKKPTVLERTLKESSSLRSLVSGIDLRWDRTCYDNCMYDLLKAFAPKKLMFVRISPADLRFTMPEICELHVLRSTAPVLIAPLGLKGLRR